MRFLTDKIAVGGLDAFHDMADLKRQGITAVLNVAAKTQPDLRGSGITYAAVPLHDNHHNPVVFAHAAVALLEGLLLEPGKVLVCCQSGVSRSASVVGMYLRSRYPEAKPSDEMLRLWEAWLKDVESRGSHD